jgi:hypothetical protein
MQSPSLHVENVVIQGFRIENCAQKMDVKVHLFLFCGRRTLTSIFSAALKRDGTDNRPPSEKKKTSGKKVM